MNKNNNDIQCIKIVLYTAYIQINTMRYANDIDHVFVREINIKYIKLCYGVPW